MQSWVLFRRAGGIYGPQGFLLPIFPVNSTLIKRVTVLLLKEQYVTVGSVGNTGKTEVLWCATGRRHHQIPHHPVRIGDDWIFSADSVRNLGIYLDSDASMKVHVSKTVLKCFAALRETVLLLGHTFVYGVYEGASQGRCWCHWSSLLCCRASTTATLP